MERKFTDKKEEITIMTVQTFLEKLKKELSPFLDFDINEDWDKEIEGNRVIDIIKKVIEENSDLEIEYSWNWNKDW